MDKNNLSYIENNSEEILNSVKEYNNNFENNNFSKTEKQIKINNLLSQNMKRYFNDSSKKYINRASICNKFIKWSKSQKGAVCDFQID